MGVRDLKTHAARILRDVRETRTSYLVTHRGRVIGLLLPADGEEEAAAQAADAGDAPAAWSTFVEAGRRLERRFTPGTSGVRLLSDARR